MDLRCRICLRSDVPELLSLSSCLDSGSTSLSDMLDAFTAGVLDTDADGWPRRVCRKCATKLEKSYAMAVRCSAEVSAEIRNLCHICQTSSIADLNQMGYICSPWNVTIIEMFHFLTNYHLQKRDKQPSLICERCLNELDSAYEFKKQLQKSTDSLVPPWDWQTMVFQANSGHLVVDLYAEALFKETLAQCSMCRLEVPKEGLKSKCDGCLLRFKNVEPDSEPEEVQDTAFDDDAVNDEIVNDEVANDQTVDDEVVNDDFSNDDNQDVHKADSSAEDSDGMDTEQPEEKETDIQKDEIQKRRRFRTWFTAHPDLKYFTVSDTVDEHFDILQRTSEMCCSCYMFFVSEEELKTHVEAEHPPKDASRVFHCDVCNKGFMKLSSYSGHRKMSSNREYYYCRQCLRFIWTEREFKFHRRFVHGRKSEQTEEGYERVLGDHYTCCECEENFGTEPELSEHRESIHWRNRRNGAALDCLYCRRKFPTAEELAEHTETFGGTYVYRCKITGCTYENKLLQRIKRHVAGVSHGDAKTSKTVLFRLGNQSKHTCCVTKCYQEFPSDEALQEHGVEEHDVVRIANEQRYNHLPYACPVCCKGYETEIQLTNHRTPQKKCCKSCFQYFEPKEFANHECIKTVQPTTLICEICGMKQRTKSGLNSHMVKLHEPPVTCSVCGVTIRKHNFTYHMAMHENKRAFQCKQCPLAFNTLDTYRQHQKKHEDKWFECRIGAGCDKRYRNSGDRGRHEKLVHLNIRPFACDYCSEAFVRERDLRLHERKHTGSRLYPCKVCGDSFDTALEQRRHLRTQCDRMEVESE